MNNKKLLAMALMMMGAVSAMESQSENSNLLRVKMNSASSHHQENEGSLNDQILGPNESKNTVSSGTLQNQDSKEGMEKSQADKIYGAADEAYNQAYNEIYGLYVGLLKGMTEDTEALKKKVKERRKKNNELEGKIKALNNALDVQKNAEDQLKTLRAESKKMKEEMKEFRNQRAALLEIDSLEGFKAFQEIMRAEEEPYQANLLNVQEEARKQAEEEARKQAEKQQQEQ